MLISAVARACSWNRVCLSMISEPWSQELLVLCQLSSCRQVRAPQKSSNEHVPAPHSIMLQPPQLDLNTGRPADTAQPLCRRPDILLGARLCMLRSPNLVGRTCPPRFMTYPCNHSPCPSVRDLGNAIDCASPQKCCSTCCRSGELSNQLVQSTG